jgi:transcriptional regulator with XRE-family HTH domain
VHKKCTNFVQVLPYKEKDMNRIKELREAAGLTQQELAERASIARNTLSLYESSTFKGKIKANVQERIAEALHQPVSLIFDPPIMR